MTDTERASWVLVESRNEAVPVVAENTTRPDDGQEWDVATEDEYHRYFEWWTGYNDAYDREPELDRGPIYQAGYAAGRSERNGA